MNNLSTTREPNLVVSNTLKAEVPLSFQIMSSEILQDLYARMVILKDSGRNVDGQASIIHLKA